VKAPKEIIEFRVKKREDFLVFLLGGQSMTQNGWIISVVFSC
jgi:hypothetical protein